MLKTCTKPQARERVRESLRMRERESEKEREKERVGDTVDSFQVSVLHYWFEFSQ